MFDADDFDAAFAELDARYLAGEAAPYAHTWSVVAEAMPRSTGASSPPTTPDWVNIDHRRGTAFAPGDLTAYIRAAWDHTPDIKIYIEAVHRLSNFGAVVTHVGMGPHKRASTPSGGIVDLLTIEGDHDQPLRAIRRGRPRRRARTVRGAAT